MPTKKKPVKKQVAKKPKSPAASKSRTAQKKSKPAKQKAKTPIKKRPTASVSKTKSKKEEKTRKMKKTEQTSQREEIIQEIKQSLMAQKDSLLKEAEETLNSLPTELNFPDMGDQATAETDRNFMLRLRDRERMLLRKIEETIERIDSGEYGMCQECGNEIGIKRLQARPVTTFCIDCKTRQEEEERIAEGGGI